MTGLNSFRQKAAELVSQMTTIEKARLVSGKGLWETRGCERLGLKKIDLADGPHGVRKQKSYADVASDETHKSVGFPTGSCVSGSWDVELLKEMGERLGKNAKLHDISVLLGPGVNIKRSPLCGRNFEYFSEDPHLSGELAKAYIQGLQSTGVSAAVKHFAANNQETRRMTVSSIIDERTLREIYLPSFEKAVKQGGSDVIMSAYNGINGTLCSKNRRLLTEILRDEWGYDGMVVSDWGAVNDDIASVAAGNDLKMPGFDGNPEKIQAAVESGKLTEEALTLAAESVTALILKASHIKETLSDWGKGDEDFEGNHNAARRIAAESLVLLKNDNILPISKDKKLLIVGEYAQLPHFQGGGSSNVNTYRVDNGIEIFKNSGYNFSYTESFENESAILEAAKGTDLAIVYTGTPASGHSEGFDRENMDLPDEQNKIIAALCAAGLPVVVVLYESSAVSMPWAGDVKGILAAFLPGEAGSGAVYDVLTGAVNPSGKLAETFTRKLSDTSAYLYFPGEGDESIYNEGLFVGYRYYEKKEITPLFPFGHGLSYTNFTYSPPKPVKQTYNDNETVTFTINITNSGALPGKEIVQIYVAPDKNTAAKGIIRPIKELKAFQKVHLNPGETKELTFNLNFRDFAHYNITVKDWRVKTGKYSILAAASSSDIRGEFEIEMTSTHVDKVVITRDSLMSDALASPGGSHLDAVIKMIMPKIKERMPNAPGGEEAFDKLVGSMPVKTLVVLGLTMEQVEALVDKING